ncbi:hypothetical protein CkaCkLH20_00264 [Colletotrichum karsti]|uniref:Mg2+ transporter zinc transport protein n=1 Tax=Colletotrichum karsti TaxID=1095194 RepID=A0A9P6IG75_9PEZI|nr:uncharacterized protein CkaCkLH20_00264 [Colletotrichum karsti]KAF9882228.1 hypothetical protein CkaCkLH20_00264 [Colletotrichum karsti]
MATPKLSKPPDPIAQAAETGRSRRSYYSFGNEGITATVGTSGRLMQISRYIPGKKTGFCVSDPDMPQPYYVWWRLDTLLSQARDISSKAGIGPCMDSLCSWDFPAKEDVVNDRWPTFSRTSKNGIPFKLRYVASGSTVYQEFEFDYSDEKSEGKPLPSLSVKPDVLIRELDFVDNDNKFNRNLNEGEAYAYETHVYGNRISREHKIGNEKIVFGIQVLNEQASVDFMESEDPLEPVAHPESVETSESPEPTGFVESTEPAAYAESSASDESAQSVKSTHQGPTYSIHWSSATEESALENGSKGKVLKIVLAYTLEAVSDDESGRLPPPSWSSYSEAKNLFETFETHPLVDDPSLDFFMRRNLEHILSVCSIPVTETKGDEIPAIALTCGDVDGHRVASAASFYAFQFLLLALRHFRFQHESLPCSCGKTPSTTVGGPYICVMKRRIERVCKGHIKWLFQEVNPSGKLFCPNYWINGEEITGWQQNEYLPQKSLVDAPFQFIKAGDFYELIGEKMPNVEAQAMRLALKAWVDDLDSINKLGLYAFPCYEEDTDREPTQTFYLTDHALIWQALKSAENIRLASKIKSQKDKSYSSHKLQQNILKRFTTENPMSKQRMIAAKRSPAQTRFLFRAKDAALFRAMELGLFKAPGASVEKGDLQSSIDVWNNTINCQQHHEENDDADWDDPRRFALAIIMAQYKKPMNLRPRAEMLEHAISVLLRSSSANGSFSGKLAKHEPAIYESERLRDNHWGTTFEVPYILWKYYCARPEDERQAVEAKTVHDRLESMSHTMTQICTLLGDLAEGQTGSKGHKRRHGYWMKHNLPFNNMVDEENIIELQDEWLYNEPAFFSPAPVIQAEPNVSGEASNDHRASIENFRLRNTHSTVVPMRTSNQFVGLMIDVPKRKPLKKKRSEEEGTSIITITTDQGVLDLTRNVRRDKKKSKKRFWAFVSASPSSNQACIETVPSGEEKEAKEIETFVSRHETYDNFFTEVTAAILNTWTTEFHLSFYSLVQVKKERSQRTGDMGESRDIPFPTQKIAMGFRFEGDFFDRYWTCRFLEADPEKSKSSKEETVGRMRSMLGQAGKEEWVDLQYGLVSTVKTGPWQQRRVLELKLFEAVVERMNESAKGILDEAKEIFEGKRDNLEKRLKLLNETQENSNPARKVNTPTEADGQSNLSIDYRSFLVTSRQLQKFQNTLQAVEGDFSENNAKIELWLKREKDRQAERPRWTFNDESRYRVIIHKLLVKNDRNIQELRRKHAKISGLIESITKELELVRSNLEIMRSDQDQERSNLDQRRAEDIKLFTYVTAFFLPLGFATGVFSMSEAPEVQTLGNMIATAVGGLVFTALLLLAAKSIHIKDLMRLLRSTNSGFGGKQSKLASTINSKVSQTVLGSRASTSS